MAALALMGLASSFLITSRISADEERPPETRNEENREIARGGCGSNCGGGSNRPARDRRFGGSLSQRDLNNPPPDSASCGGKGPQGSCHGNGSCNGSDSQCNGKTGCHGNGSCNGYSKSQQNMKNKRSNTMNK